MLENDIRKVLEAKAAALVARDAGRLEKLIHDQFVYINAGGRRFDKRGYIDTFCTSGRVVFTKQRFSNLVVKLINDFAITTLEIADELRIDGQETIGCYTSLCVFGRSSIGWQWAAGQTMAI